MPRKAKNATTIADGTVVLLPPLTDAMSGPKTASKSTASHMTAIAGDAHISSETILESQR